MPQNYPKILPPELLAPAGNWDCAKAAVENGANAVYFGLPAFNARLRADNFTFTDLKPLVDYLHAHGVRAYVTLNTLIFSSELPEACKFVDAVANAKVDSVIVQDIGLAKIIRERAPDVAVHASTQMTITSPEGVRFAEKLGAQRVVLARELSLRELEKFSPRQSIPLEVFVHGALCVAYSGQCLTSEALGQRSANRGECAQACRLPYGLVVDGALKDLGDKRYLLSPQDLAAVEEIPALIRAGIQSFKIEGRLKSPEYVAAICQVYRKAIDATTANPELSFSLSSEDRYMLEMAFSRGLYKGWVKGVNHQELVHARFGKKRGAFVGLVRSIGPDFIEITPQCPIHPGDGVVFDVGGDTDREQGGRIWQIRQERLYFEKGKINFQKIFRGTRVWKTDDPQLNKKLQQSYARATTNKKIPARFVLSGKLDHPLSLSGSLADGRKSTVSGQTLLIHAQNRPLTKEFAEQQIGRLGDSPYEMESLEFCVDDGLIVPVKELNQIKRSWIDSISALPHPSVISITEAQKIEPAKLEDFQIPATQQVDIVPKLVALCRTNDQINAAHGAGIDMVYLDFEDIRRFKDAVTHIRDLGGLKVYLATPRIQKAGENGFFQLLEQAQPDGVLIRNLGGIEFFKDKPFDLVGDFSLNVANPLSASILKDHGLKRLTISYDLNFDQVMDLVSLAPPEWFEITLHQHLPMFHMEHCVFAAFLSKGTDYTNCGRPCEHHDVRMRDRVGMDHPLKADVGCRNTVFHAKAQSGAEYYNSFYRGGIRSYRVELLTENHAESTQILKTYKNLVEGRIAPVEVCHQVKAVKQLGVTSGTLTVL